MYEGISFQKAYHSMSRREICFLQLQNLEISDIYRHTCFKWVSQEPSIAEHSTTATLNTAIPAQHSTHTEAARCFSYDKAKQRLENVTSMRGRAGCQNIIRHLSPILLLLKAETQGTTFFLSCDSYPRILLFSE